MAGKKRSPAPAPTLAPARGARRRSEIPPAVLAELNAGTREARNLVEGLAVDMARLMAAAFPEWRGRAVARVQAAAELGITRRMELCGQVLWDEGGVAILPRAAEHPSDTVRGWACYLIGLVPEWSLAERLRRIRPLAEDRNSGVREWAWLPLRSHVAADLPLAVRRLTPWTRSRSAYLRRFASELTRPRGVWTNHLEQLKVRPELGLPLLEPLRADGEKYVQDSVANWLNDAGKSRPDFVRALCARWRRESPGPATARICARALRRL